MCVSAVVFAERMVIHGKPVKLEVHEGFYTFPEEYKNKKNYHFVILAGIERVCFLTEKPSLSALDMISIIIEHHGLQLQWFCYRYDPYYFEIDF